MRTLYLLLATLVAVPTGALAQSVSAEPNYGTFELDAGFMPDPQTVDLRAGGGVANGVEGCSGYLTEVQDVDLDYGGGNPLYIYASSEADITLLVNLPDGSWACNDDAVGTDPLLQLPGAAGRYNIWVGIYARVSAAPATLFISEVDPR